MLMYRDGNVCKEGNSFGHPETHDITYPQQFLVSDEAGGNIRKKVICMMLALDCFVGVGQYQEKLAQIITRTLPCCTLPR